MAAQTWTDFDEILWVDHGRLDKLITFGDTGLLNFSGISTSYGQLAMKCHGWIAARAWTIWLRFEPDDIWCRDDAYDSEELSKL